MIGECECGEVLMADAENCPACGAVNESYTPPSGHAVPILVGAGVLGGLGSLLGIPWYLPVLILCAGVLAVALTRAAMRSS